MKNKEAKKPVKVAISAKGVGMTVECASNSDALMLVQLVAPNPGVNVKIDGEVVLGPIDELAGEKS
jgi:hypothetical protein